MTYNEAITYIESLSSFGIKLGLEQITKLLNLLGNPQDSLKFIHFAGTNGKGSTSTMTANILKESGQKVGLYTSPYSNSVRESIIINNEQIPKEDFANCLKEVKQNVDILNKQGCFPTSFEVETAVAFLWFYKQNCSIVCLETGLGGTNDATNVVKTTILNVITAISLDHTDYLGNTIKEVAKHKAGIIKKAPTVLYPFQEESVVKIIKDVCKEKNSKLIVPNPHKVDILDTTYLAKDFIYKSLVLRKNLAGVFQIYNAITAYEVITELKNQDFKISNKHIYDGIIKTNMPLRLEILNAMPLVIFDGAHNKSGMDSLEFTLKKLKDKNITVIFGVLKDKDYKYMLNTIGKYAKNLICISPNNPRALDVDTLYNSAKKYTNLTTYLYYNMESAVKFVHSQINVDDVVIICGSLYLAKDIIPIIKDTF